MRNTKYSEIIKKNKQLENALDTKEYKIAILSNIMVHQSKDICEYSLRTESINAKVYLGDYDNILQDSIKFNDMNVVLIFWELYNLIDGLQYKINLITDKEFKELINKVKIEIGILLNSLHDTPLVLINKFSTLVFEQNSLNATRLQKLSNILNQELESKITKNIKIIDIDKIISIASIQKSIDLRYYYSSKTLYSIEFYKTYFEHIKPIFLSVNGKSKKALIFDCDNTLWKGILGEEGFDNIKIYKEVQYLAVELAKSGVIIGLCSKNNPEDVDKVLKEHKDMILLDEHIVIKKVNWNDKVSNLKLIAKELNIGLDSLVFVDDSNFEVNLIREELPQIQVYQVPLKEYEYSMMIRKINNLFYNITRTDEDIKKLDMYKAQIQRTDEEEKIGNIDDYLKSLQLEITLYIDDKDKAARISQMTQKTNQFNLTTKRYTEIEIKKFIEDKNKAVLAIGVNDKFGDSGVVGLAILDIFEEYVIIDTLLMSCRVLGRNIEYKFMDIIVEYSEKIDISIINSKYISSYKNQQVEDLFDRYGFDIIRKDETFSDYSLNVKEYKNKNIDYIKVKSGK